jgi:hypothetical protein
LPNGDGGTVLVQSLCAKALEAIAMQVTKAIPVNADVSRMTVSSCSFIYATKAARPM